MAVVIAIDAGTTGVRSRAVFTDGRVAPVASYREFTQHFPRPGLGRARRRRDLGGRAGHARRASSRPLGEPVAAIGITNQRETVRGVGPRDRRSRCTGAIVWQDRRTAERCDELAAAGAPAARAASAPASCSTRTSRAPSSRGCSGHGGVGRSTPTWPSARSTPGSLWNLTGGAVHATDPSNASRTMLFDIRTLAWSRRAVRPARRAARRPARGAPVERTLRRHRRAAAACPAGIPDRRASPATSRPRCSARPASRPGMAKNTYGTGSFVLMNVGADVPAAGRRAC